MREGGGKGRGGEETDRAALGSLTCAEGVLRSPSPVLMRRWPYFLGREQ